MRHLLNRALVREVALFAGAYAAIRAVGSVSRGRVPAPFASRTAVVAHGFVPVLSGLLRFAETAEVERLLADLEAYLELCDGGNVRQHGFEANRRATACVTRLKAVLARCKRAADDGTAMEAIVFEREALPQFETMVDDTMYNMLLDARQ